MQFLLKIGRLGNNAVVLALALGDDKTSSFDLLVKDYISDSAFPITSADDLARTLRDVFISEARLNDLIGLFKVNVILKLAPGLYKEGYEDTTQALRERQQERPPQHDPLRMIHYLNLHVLIRLMILWRQVLVDQRHQVILLPQDLKMNMRSTDLLEDIPRGMVAVIL